MECHIESDTLLIWFDENTNVVKLLRLRDAATAAQTQMRWIFSYLYLMKIEEAIVYCLATSNRGMRTEQIADMINRQRLHLRKDGQPVTSKQVYAVVCRYPDMFVKAEGRIMLMI